MSPAKPGTPLAALAALLAAGCVAGRDVPDLGRIYDEAAKVHDLRRNPVVVIPGILGSKLVDGEAGTVVWGAFEGGYANPTRPAGARLFSIPMGEGVPLGELRDGVRSAGALERVRAPTTSSTSCWRIPAPRRPQGAHGSGL